VTVHRLLITALRVAENVLNNRVIDHQILILKHLVHPIHRNHKSYGFNSTALPVISYTIRRTTNKVNIALLAVIFR